MAVSRCVFCFSSVMKVSMSSEYLAVNVLDGDLKPVEAAGLRELHLVHEACSEVLVHDAVAGREEGQHVRIKYRSSSRSSPNVCDPR